MDSKIETLLEKYWKCETTLEEEQELKEYFKASNVPDELKDTATLFRYFNDQKKLSLSDAGFDSGLKTKINATKPKGKHVKMIYNVARIAAGLVVVVAATFFVRQEIRKSYPPEIADTYSDPKMAFEETKKALMMISKGFGKAHHEAEKIKLFNQAEEQVQKGNSSEQKDEANI